MKIPQPCPCVVSYIEIFRPNSSHTEYGLEVGDAVIATGDAATLRQRISDTHEAIEEVRKRAGMPT